MYSTAILPNTATITEEKSTEIDSVFQLKLYRERDTGLRAITASPESKKQPNKFSQLQNIQVNLLTVTFLAI